MENKVIDFINTNIEKGYDGKVLVIINSFHTSYNNDIAIRIHNHLKAMPNEFYTIITEHCKGISFIPFLAAKKENRFSLSKTSIILDYKTQKSNHTKLNEYYKNFEKNLISNETKISDNILEKVFENNKTHRINYLFFDNYEIATIISNFSQLPLPLEKCIIIDDYENEKIS